jgi:hypothetical protein
VAAKASVADESGIVVVTGRAAQHARERAAVL